VLDRVAELDQAGFRRGRDARWGHAVIVGIAARKTSEMIFRVM